MSDNENTTYEAEESLKSLVNDFNFTYEGIQKNILKTIDERIKTLGIPSSAREGFVIKGIELLTDLSLKISIAKVTNKDNLALKALDSNSSMIGMLAQGGLEISQQQFEIYYSALKEIMNRGGITIKEYVPEETPSTDTGTGS